MRCTVLELTERLKRTTVELELKDKRVWELEGQLLTDIAEVWSKEFQTVLALGARVVRLDSSVLLVGETGVGKEVIARYIHDKSERRHKRFVAVDCSALPETILERELLGYKAGSFTGAVRDRKGLFEEADGGTIFLDEIGEVSTAI